MPNPTGIGGWKKGRSGNPNGRRRTELAVFGNLAVEARKFGALALSNLVQLAQKAENESVRLQAAIAILDRGYGRPTQSIELSTDAAAVQVNMFQGLGLDDPDRLEADLARVVELKVERERELAAIGSASTIDAEAVQTTDAGATDDAEDRDGT